MANKVKIFDVDGISCSHCEKSIINAVGNLEGINKVSVNLETKKVTVEFDAEKVDNEKIKETIEDQGYDVK